MKAKITKRLVDSIQPAEKDIYVWDTELRNFCLKVTPKGKRVYYVQYRIGSRRRKYTIGNHGSLTPNQARSEAAKVLQEVTSGGDPQLIKRQEVKNPTISELAERYMSEHAETKKKASSIKRDRELIDRFVVPKLGTRKVEEVTRPMVAKFHHELRKTPTQANRALAVLSKMFSLAELWGLRADNSNPCRHVQRYKEKARERFLSPEELSRLGKVLSKVEKKNKEWPSVVTLVRLLILTGARQSEIINLKWEDVDFDLEILRIPDSKTGAKLIPMSGPVREILEKAPRIVGNDYVCFGRKPGEPLKWPHGSWSKIRKKAEIEDVRLHDLRHSFASIGVGAGLGLPIIGALLGHTQAATTQRYAHLANDPLKAATEEIGQKITEAMSKEPSKGKVIPIRKKRG